MSSDDLIDRVAWINTRLITALHAVQRCQDAALDEALDGLDSLGGQYAVDTAIDALCVRRDAMTSATREAWAAVDEVTQLDLDLVTHSARD